MEPSVDRARARQPTCIDAGEKTSAELDASTVKAMLSEMSGTPLDDGPGWDGTAKERLRAFQRSEGLPATGMPDDVTVARLTRRFEEVSASRKASALHAPSEAAHSRVTKALEGAVHSAHDVAEQLEHDSPIRARYIQEVEAWSKGILGQFERGEITEAEAALLANKFRNAMLTDARTGLSPAGAAISKLLKEEGLSLAQLCEKYAAKEFGGRAFKDLTAAERNDVLLHIAKRAGVTNESVNGAARMAPHLGKAILAVGVALAFYQVATAEDKVEEGVKQAAGWAGFWAGAKVGALVGATVCGPGAPACAVVTGLAFGIMGSYLAEEAAVHTYHAVKG